MAYIGNEPSYGVFDRQILAGDGTTTQYNLDFLVAQPSSLLVSMDGIIIDYTSFKNGQRAFKIEGIQAAGSEQITLLNTKNCIEVMTGAVLPNNANTVIRYEDIRIDNGFATITIDTINKGQNIHTKGKDGKAGALLILSLIHI